MGHGWHQVRAPQQRPQHQQRSVQAAVIVARSERCRGLLPQDTGTDEDLDGQMMLNRLIYFQTHSAEKGALYYVPGSIHMGHLTQFVGDHHDPLPGEVKILPTAVRCLMPACPSDRLRSC